MGPDVYDNRLVRIACEQYLIDSGITVPDLDPLFLTDVTLTVKRLIPTPQTALWRPVFVMFFALWADSSAEEVFEAVVFRGGVDDECLYGVLQSDKGVVLSLIEHQ